MRIGQKSAVVLRTLLGMLRSVPIGLAYLFLTFDYRIKNSDIKSKRSLPPLQSDFVAESKWLNKLPPVPHSSKVLVYPFEADRFVKYKNPTSLEQTFRFDLHAEVDLGLELDISDVDAWEGTNFLAQIQAGLPPAKRRKSEKQVREAAQAAFAAMPQEDMLILADSRQRVLANNTSVLSEGQPAAAPLVQSSARYADESEESVYTREILESFEGVDVSSREKAWRHPSNGSLHPVAVWNVLPDTELWPTKLFDIQLESTHQDILSIRDDIILKGMKVRGAESQGPAAEDIMAVIGPSSSTDRSQYAWKKEYNFSHIDSGELHMLFFVPQADTQHVLQHNSATYKLLDRRTQLKKRNRASSALDSTYNITVQTLITPPINDLMFQAPL